MIDRAVVVVVPGRPRPKSRPRFRANGSVYSVKEQVVQEDAIAWALRAKLGHRRFEGKVDVHARFFCPNRTHGDGDNLLKLVLDAANGIAYADDKQVRRGTFEIELDKANPRTEIRISIAQSGGEG